MPREQSKRISHAPVVDAGVASTVPDLAARPVNRYVAPEENSLLRLADSLSKASPSFQKFIDGRHRQHQTDEQTRARVDAELLSAREVISRNSEARKVISETNSPEYVEEFNRVSDLRLGNIIAGDLESKFETDFNIETDDIDLFFEEQIESKLKGIDTESLEHALEPISSAKQRIMAKWFDNVAKRKTEQRSTLVYSQLEALIDSEDLSIEGIDEIYSAANNKLKLPYRDIDSLVVEAAEVAANNGNYKAFDVLKQKRKGAPSSIFDNPKHSVKLHQLEEQAIATHIRNYEAEEKASEELLKEKKEATTSDLYAAYFDGQNILVSLEKAREQNLVSTEDYKQLRKAIKDDLEDSQEFDSDETVEATIETRIYEGVINRAEIVEAFSRKEINRQSLTRLMRLHHSISNKEEKDVFDSTEYKQASQFLKSQFGQSYIDYSGDLERKKANALRLFNERAKELTEDNYQGIWNIADDVRARFGVTDNAETLPQSKYSSVDALIKALENEEITAAEFNRERKLLNNE